MKVLFLFAALFTLVIITVAPAEIGDGNDQLSPFRKPAHQYIGVKSCKVCHASAKLGGEEYKVWEKSPHAKAFQTLGTDAAKKIAKPKGIDDPQKDARCVKCHTIGSGVEAQWIGEKVTQEEGVSCEACHAPGADYKKKEIMKDKKKSAENGLVIPTEATCRACHNEESPNYKPFNYQESREKIKHWKKKSDG